MKKLVNKLEKSITKDEFIDISYDVVEEIEEIEENKEQTERITLNLDNYQGDIEELKDMILRKTNGDLKNLKELLVVKDGEITRWFARGE